MGGGTCRYGVHNLTWCLSALISCTVTDSFPFVVLLLLSDSQVSSFLHTHWPLIMRHVLRVRNGIEETISSGIQFLGDSIPFLQVREGHLASSPAPRRPALFLLHPNAACGILLLDANLKFIPYGVQFFKPNVLQ